MIYKIESRQNEKVVEATKLSNIKYSKEVRLFKIEGFHALEMALESGNIKSVFTTNEITNLPKEIPQYLVTPSVMEKISTSKTPQGVVMICEFIKEKPITSKKVLVLDDVQDPGNLGTLLRTALAYEFNDVILLNGCSQYNEKVLQSTQGAIFKLNIRNLENLAVLKDYEIYATEIKGSVDINNVKPTKKFALILGNEAHGVSNKNLLESTKRIRIDIKNIESLNVAVAGGIAMHVLSK